MELSVLFLNTYLLRSVPVPWVGRRVHLGAPPGYRHRARELGPRLRGRADVLALAEVWEHREREVLLDAWPDGERPTVVEGPGAGPIAIRGAGLRTFVDGFPVRRSEHVIFRSRGHLLIDADVYANKGVLLTAVAIADGVELEVFSTHLCWGGGLLPSRRRPPGQRQEVRAAQVADLAAFIARTHRVGNPILVVGDFNFPAVDRAGEPGEEYLALGARLKELGLADVWPIAGGPGPGDTCDLVKFPGQLGPPDPDDPDLLLDLDDGSNAPRSDRTGAAATIGAPARIDLAFFAPGDGAPELRVVSMRRAAFPRFDHQPTESDPLMTLSDHAGLLLTLSD